MSDEITPRPAPASHGAGPLGRLARLVSVFYGDAARDRVTEPIRHRHDGLEDEIDQQIASIAVQTDSGGRHYGVRKPVAGPPAEPVGPGISYRNYGGRPRLGGSPA